MNIVALGDINDGCFYHRCVLPMAFFDLPKENRLITNSLEDQSIFDRADIIFINRGLYQLPAEALDWKRSKCGFKIVLDLDDWWELDPHHIGYNEYREGHAQLTIDNIKVADLVTVTHDRLADKVRPYNANVVVMNPGLPYGVGQFEVPKAPSESGCTRFVYCGSMTHERDLELLRHPMKRVYGDKQLRDRMHMTFTGYTDAKECKHIADKMLHSFTHGLKMKGNIRGTLPVSEYMALYSETDVSIIPLLDTEFNSMKSCLKILEAAAARNSVIVSGVHPYRDFEGLVEYVNRQTDWYKTFRYMADMRVKGIRDEIAADLRSHCESNYDVRVINKRRLATFAEII